jgi:hypothetical protein
LNFREDKELGLYRFEYLSDGYRSVDWVWLGEDETKDYLANDEYVTGLIYRKATPDEEELYQEAYTDGHELGTVESNMAHSNEVYYKVLSFTGDEAGMKTQKIFTCGECKTRALDFEETAAKFGPYFITKDVDSVLWYICADCVSK